MQATRICTVPDCDRTFHARGMCLRHYLRWREKGTTDAPSAAKKPPGYDTAHRRVRSQRGPARTHDCVECHAVAAHWSYDYGDPQELIDPKTGSPYSADPTHYQPRCAECHASHDQAQRLRRNPLPAERPCRVCGVVKPLVEFYADSRRLDGHASRCKDCDREAQRQRGPRRRRSDRRTRAELLEEIDRLRSELEDLRARGAAHGVGVGGGSLMEGAGA